MKKIFVFVLVLLFGFAGYLLYDNLFSKKIPKLHIEDEIVSIDSLTIYGTYLNLHGNIINGHDLDLVLYNGKYLEYDINIDDDKFNLSNKINEGIYLENIPAGLYYMFLRSHSTDENNKDIYKYYALNNKTKYKETTYYTFSNRGNKIVINSDNDYNTIMFTVSKNNNHDVFDIVIDPGHGGMDTGAAKNGYYEADFTMKIANDLKKKMESFGVKVKLTREENQLSKDEVLDAYGKNGRSVIGHNVNAKYLLSIHMNSNASPSVHGIEIYTADNINYNFAKKLASNITTIANTGYSNNKINKVYDGIYTRTFTEKDIQDSFDEYESKNLKAYNITTKSNYYFIIRETGGIMTGAYVDDRNKPKIDGNPYFDSNLGLETYLLELAYLTNNSDLDNMNKNMDKYTTAIANTFKDVFVINK